MSGGLDAKQRRGVRTKAVLPVRVRGKDSTGKAFDELVHTLDVARDGVRLGSVRHQFNVLDEVIVFYRQRRIQFRVVWTKKLAGTAEFQVGLRAVTQDSEAWGLNFANYETEAASQSEVATSAGA